MKHNTRQLRPGGPRSRSRDCNRMLLRRVNHPPVNQLPINQPPVMMTTRISTKSYPPLYQRIKGGSEGSSSSNSNGQGLTSDMSPIDLTSKQGKFLWVTIGTEDLPAIKRGKQSYISTRMVEVSILSKYFFLHPDIISCAGITSYFITSAEAELLSSINADHCDNKFGEEDFNISDLIVKMEDVQEFWDFLYLCFLKLLHRSPCMNPHCGFLHINRESVIAYSIKNGVRYVPLFYFDGVNSQLRNKAEVLEGWEVAYLKFCCLVQGIRKELFNKQVIALKWDDIKNYFPPNTLFENYWPQ